jgi:hypothetical protein
VELIGIEVIEAAENDGRSDTGTRSMLGVPYSRPWSSTASPGNSGVPFRAVHVSLLRECATRDECLQQRLRVSVVAFEL